MLAGAVLVLGRLARDVAASASSTPRWPRSARSCGRRPTGWSPATRCSRCTTRAARRRTSAASCRSSELPSRDPGVLRQPRQAAGAGRGDRRLRHRGARCAAPGWRCRWRCWRPASATFVLIGIAGAVGDRALPRGRRARAAGVRRRSRSAAGRMLEPRPAADAPGWSRRSAPCSSASSFTATRLDLSASTHELTFRGEAHDDLTEVLDDPRVQAGLRCGPLTFPNHKLVPDARWIADLPFEKVLARADPDVGDRAARRRDLRHQPLRDLQARADEPTTDPALVQVPPRRLRAREGHAVLLGVRARAERPRAGWPLRRRSAWSPARSRCGCGASSTACRTSTTPTRTPTSCRARSGCSGTPTTRATSSTRRPHVPRAPRVLPALGRARGGRRRVRAPTATRRVRARADRVARCSARWRSGCCCGPGARLFGRRAGLIAARAAGGRVPAGPLLPLRAQRRADAGAGVPRAARASPGSAAAGAAGDYALAGAGARPGLRDQVHGGDRCCVTLLPPPRSARAASAPRRAARARAGGRARARRASSSRTRTRCWTSTRSATGSSTSPSRVGRRRRQARPHAGQRHPLLPRDADLGARLAARAGRRWAARSALLLRDRAARGRARPRARRCSSLFMGLQDRFFARWLLPVYPLLCLLAAWACVAAATWLAARLRRRAAPVLAARWARCCAPRGWCSRSTTTSCSSRADTRQLARDWMVDNIPVRLEGRGRADRARPPGRRTPRASPAAPATASAGTSGRPARASQRRHAARRGDRQARGLRAHHAAGAGRLLRARRLLLGGDRLDPVRPRLRRARARCRTRSRYYDELGAAASSSTRRSPYGEPRGPRAVLVRLLVQRLPARLRAARARDPRSTGCAAAIAARHLSSSDR